MKATANYIHDHGGEFVLPVKENQRSLSDAVNALPWDKVPVAHAATGKGHGRIITRTVQVLPAPDGLPFPHVSQVFLIERYVTGLHGKPAGMLLVRPGPIVFHMWSAHIYEDDCLAHVAVPGDTSLAGSMW